MGSETRLHILWDAVFIQRKHSCHHLISYKSCTTPPVQQRAPDHTNTLRFGTHYLHTSAPVQLQLITGANSDHRLEPERSIDVDSGHVSGYSLVAAVPLPGVARPVGQKVSRSLVSDSLREPQQHPGVVVPDRGAVSGAAGTRRRRRCT